MKTIRLLGGWAAGALLISSAPARDLKTFNGEVYNNITITKKDATGLQISHQDGVAFVDFRNLAPTFVLKIARRHGPR